MTDEQPRVKLTPRPIFPEGAEGRFDDGLDDLTEIVARDALGRLQDMMNTYKLLANEGSVSDVTPDVALSMLARLAETITMDAMREMQTAIAMQIEAGGSKSHTSRLLEERVGGDRTPS
jgi:hypothetical protein